MFTVVIIVPIDCTWYNLASLFTNVCVFSRSSCLSVHHKSAKSINITFYCFIQKIGKERGNSYKKLERSLGERRTQIHGSVIETFQLSFCVFVYAFVLEIFSFFGKFSLSLSIFCVIHTLVLSFPRRFYCFYLRNINYVAHMLLFTYERILLISILWCHDICR